MKVISIKINARDDFIDASALAALIYALPKDPYAKPHQNLKDAEVLGVRSEDDRPRLGHEPKPEA